MKVCEPHWAMFRAAIDKFGMTALVPSTANDAVVRQSHGGVADWDPLMAMFTHYMQNAIQEGGLYLLSQDPSGTNDGHYCPVCEYVKYAEDFDANRDIEKIAGQMAEWARSQGLLPALS